MLPREARQILAKLELISHGSITAYNKSGGPSSEHPGGKRPEGNSNPPHIVYRLKMEARPGDIPALIREATQVWETLTGHTAEKRKPITVKTEAELIVEDGKGFTPYEVSLKFRCSETTVRKARLAAGRDTETGEAQRDIAPPDRLTEAIRLRKQGASFRTVEERTGISKSTLFDAMKRAA